MNTAAQAVGLTHFEEDAVECSCFSAVPTNATVPLGDAHCATSCGDDASPLACGDAGFSVDGGTTHPTAVYTLADLRRGRRCEAICRARCASPTPLPASRGASSCGPRRRV